MADLGLYANFLERARLEEALRYRRNCANLRNLNYGFEITDREFVKLYRLTKSLTRDLVSEIEPYLPRQSRGLTTASQVLCTLHFYASGSYQRHVGASAHFTMHQVSVSKSIRAVTLALNNSHFREKYIHFPQNREERNHIKQGFYQKFGMPGMIGYIDGSHIAIVRPSEYEERYFNRKRYHSLNTQIICDSDLNILNIDASHGGASHDSHIWNSHPIKRHLEHLHGAGNETVMVLGDSGYPLRPTIMTPILNTEPNTPERYYTDLHCRVRNTVERCIGVLKARWRCLLVDRKLHYTPTMAGYITNACAALHNIANHARLPVPELTREEAGYEAVRQVHPEAPPGDDSLGAGQEQRRLLVERLWSAR